jgi:hypothetical protein
MNIDFSSVNLQYLIQSRDLTKQDPQLPAVLLGIPDEMVGMLPSLSSHQLTQIIQIKPPLLIPRQDAWWWYRLFTALDDGRPDEIEAVIEHASLNDLRMLHATLIWHLHQRLSRIIRGAARALIDLFEAYSQLARKPLLDLTRTMFVPHLVTMDTWYERLCKFCGMTHLAPVDNNSIACPGCRFYHRHRCLHCHSPLVPQSRGCRRATCGHCGSKLKIGIQE